jgi:hypothetical protein
MIKSRTIFVAGAGFLSAALATKIASYCEAQG